MPGGFVHMKYMIASDIHGSAVFSEKLAEAFYREKADRLVLLGDLLYHGPRNGIPEGYDPQKTAEILNSLKDSVLCIHGNCDSEVDQLLIDFPITQEFGVLEHGKRLIFLTHGHILNPDSPPNIKRGDIVMYGHFHVPACIEKNGCIFMNPGSVSIPKENSWNGYMTVEGSDYIWKDIEGIIKLRWTDKEY